MSDVRDRPTEGDLVRTAGEALCEYAGAEETTDRDIWFDNAQVVVDALIDAAMVFPAERFDEDCHRCTQPIRDHRVDGRCPEGFDD